MNSPLLGVAMGAMIGLSGCHAERLFYYPNKVLYADPHNAGLEYEIIDFESADGNTLYGLYFETPLKPKGTIIHFHGNHGNVSSHFPLSIFLLKYGFDVLIFDYQGYGGSEGHPARQNTIDDGLAAVRYAKKRLRSLDGGLGIFGQSLGAAVGTVAAAEDMSVDAVVLEAGFTTYRSIAADAMRHSPLTWLFSYFLPPLLVRKRYEPIDYVGRISPRPVLIIHGTKDRTIPLKMGRRLFAAAREPKELWVVEGGQHLGYRRVAGREYEERVGDFFTQAFANRASRDATP